MFIHFSSIKSEHNVFKIGESPYSKTIYVKPTTIDFCNSGYLPLLNINSAVKASKELTRVGTTIPFNNSHLASVISFPGTLDFVYQGYDKITQLLPKKVLINFLANKSENHYLYEENIDTLYFKTINSFLKNNDFEFDTLFYINEQTLFSRQLTNYSSHDSLYQVLEDFYVTNNLYQSYNNSTTPNHIFIKNVSEGTYIFDKSSGSLSFIKNRETTRKLLATVVVSNEHLDYVLDCCKLRIPIHNEAVSIMLDFEVDVKSSEYPYLRTCIRKLKKMTNCPKFINVDFKDFSNKPEIPKIISKKTQMLEEFTMKLLTDYSAQYSSFAPYILID